MSQKPAETAPAIVREVHAAYSAHARAVHAQHDLPALARLFREAVRQLDPSHLAILDLRLEHTLAAIGEEIGLSRERVRQLERTGRRRLRALAEAHAPEMLRDWEERLTAGVVSERELFFSWEAAALDDRAEFRLARMLLLSLEAVHPATYGTELSGWWTFSRDALKRPLSVIASALPLEDGDLDELVARVLPAQTLPIRQLLSDTASPAVFHRGAGGWVRRLAIKRDAAYLVLLRAGEPIDAHTLSTQVETNPHALREGLNRDSRFRSLRPSGEWALCEWKDSDTPQYRNTLDAAIAVLSEHGPLTYDQFERRVLERYPVSAWSVKQCLGTEQVGRWPDGRIDLAVRGAPVVEDEEPQRPAGVEIEGDALVLDLCVTRDMLRGSGLQIPSYVTWWLGLKVAPRKQEFSVTGAAPLTVKRFKAGPAVSSLRTHAVALGASEGCVLRVKLDRTSKAAEITLGCKCDCHVEASSVSQRS